MTKYKDNLCFLKNVPSDAFKQILCNYLKVKENTYSC